MKTVIICIIAFFLGSAVLGGTIDPKAKDSQHIEYAKNFKCIYKICGRYQGESNTFFYASAVAINPEWVLTAAHVVENAQSGYITQEDGQKNNIVKFICHSDFKKNNFGYYDIALCKVKNNLLLNFYPELYDEPDEVGRVCSIAGFGDTGNFVTGVSISDGKKRAGSNIIDQIDRHLLICTPSTARKTELEFIIANGDSGGGLFIANKLAGINSCVISSDKKTDSSYGDEGGHTRISVFKEWIHKTIATESK